MGVTLRDRYTGLIAALLPPGRAWPRDNASWMHRMAEGLADECARIHERGDDLLAEMDPSRCIEMLPEWETSKGLPGPCASALGTLGERRQALMARVFSIGDQRPGFFIDLAKSVGYDVTITENVGGDPTVWRINAPATTVRWFRAGRNRAGDRIRQWGNDLLECTIRQANPAHLILLFGYGG